MDEMDEVREEFLAESNEGLAQYDEDLVELERDPSASERIAQIFRTVHSIKGLCGFLGYANLEELTHTGESLLVPLRDGDRQVTPPIIDVLLAMGDAIRNVLDHIAAHGEEPGSNHHELIARIREQLGTASPEQTAPAAAPPPPPGPAAPEPPGPKAPSSAPSEPRAAVSIRVGVDLLEELVSLVGELVLNRNQITSSLDRVTDPSLRAAAVQLDRLTEGIQDAVLGTRMQPVRSVLSSLPRVVRDLAQGAGKRVEVDLAGEDTLLDRVLLGAIKDPLVHLVRNAVDHGIEPPDDRKAAGKPVIGRLRVEASQDDGLVLIEIHDDGRGLDLEAVRRKGEERGMIAPGDSATEAEILDLIFQPGFSTAKEVTNVSGRGVGMDVVRTNLAKIGGSVRARTEPGRGTTFTLLVPLTLAIMPAQLVECGGQSFAIPATSVREVGRFDPGPDGELEWVQGNPLFRVRDRVHPLVDLGAHLGLPPRNWMQSMPFLLVRVADDVIGLAVDRILDRVDIVVKPAGRLVDNMKQYTGATILGDGGIALIVDVPSLQDSLPLGLADRDLDRSEDPESMGTQLHLREERGSHLVFAWREGRWAALPGALVRRVRSLDGARLQRGPDGSRLALGTDIYPVFQPYFLDPGLDPPSLVDTDDSWRALVCSGADGEFVVLASELLGFRPLPDAEPGMEDALRAVLLEDNLVDVLPQALVEAHVPRATLEEVPA